MMSGDPHYLNEIRSGLGVTLSALARLLALALIIINDGCSKPERTEPPQEDSTKSVRQEKQFLASYDGQSVKELLAMKDAYRVDSIIIAIDQAIGRKPRANLTDVERVVLTVEALQREVNNGGYAQFFSNAPEFVGHAVRALELIGCSNVATITADAIAIIGPPENLETADVEPHVSKVASERRIALAKCDSRYFDNDENIGHRLFEYIEQHHDKIEIP